MHVSLNKQIDSYKFILLLDFSFISWITKHNFLDN